MARPKKENELTRTHHVNLRLTDIQYEIICNASKDAGLSLSEYIRRQVMKGKVIAKYEIVADVPELKKLIAEFGKIRKQFKPCARIGLITNEDVAHPLDKKFNNLSSLAYPEKKFKGEDSTQ